MPVLKDIQMVDLKGQYLKIKNEIDDAVLRVIASTRYIKGPEVSAFEEELAAYLGVKHVIGCANGTDALQIGLMALGLKPGDEVIVPSFTYVATAEVIGLLGLTPVMIDVDPLHFHINAELIEKAVTAKTRAIVPVHLFGQSAPMEEIMQVARAHQLFVIEDNAQSIGSEITYQDQTTRTSGTIGDIGTTSFFPAKNLGCYGDGGALFTNDDDLADKMRMIANHGQSNRYYHDRLGVNSRLDAMQAAILRIKLRHLNEYSACRRAAADAYDAQFGSLSQVITPERYHLSTHVFHQYTLQVPAADRDPLIAHLQNLGVPGMIYYPVPLYAQKAFAPYWPEGKELPVTEKLCASVMSLPMHTEMTPELIEHIVSAVKSYFNA